MALLGFCALVSVVVAAIVLVLMPPAHAHPKTGLPVGELLGRIGHVHMTRAMTVWLDVMILAIFVVWYALATAHAPRSPSPSTGQVYLLPVAVGSVGRHGGRFGLHATVFGSGYVDLVTFLLGWTVFANVALLLLWALVAFLRTLWNPPPPDDRQEPPSSYIDASLG